MCGFTSSYGGAGSTRIFSDANKPAYETVYTQVAKYDRNLFIKAHKMYYTTAGEASAYNKPNSCFLQENTQGVSQFLLVAVTKSSLPSFTGASTMDVLKLDANDLSV